MTQDNMMVMVINSHLPPNLRHANFVQFYLCKQLVSHHCLEHSAILSNFSFYKFCLITYIVGFPCTLMMGRQAPSERVQAQNWLMFIKEGGHWSWQWQASAAMRTTIEPAHQALPWANRQTGSACLPGQRDTDFGPCVSVVPSNHMKSEKIIPHNVYPAITAAQMRSR